MTLEEDVTDFANAVEAAAVNLKHRIAQRHGVDVKEETKPTEHALNSLSWENKTGSKGEYQQTSKNANNNSVNFKAVQQYVKDHKGFCSLCGFKAWFHNQDENLIDRRKG